MPKSKIQSKNAFSIAGIALVVIGIFLNEWILAGLFSEDGYFESSTRLKIWVFDIGLVASGIIFIRFPNFAAEVIRRSHNFWTLILGLGMAALLFLGIEGIFGYLNEMDPKRGLVQNKGGYKEITIADDLLGYKPKPNSRVTSVMKIPGQVLYDIHYTTDAFSRRLTPTFPVEGRDRFALFFGGSFAFGEGVEDDETVPFYFGEAVGRYRPYNYAYSGYGPQMTLAKLEAGDLSREVTENNGVLIYVFTNNHVNRAVGTLFVYEWGWMMPYYQFQDGRFVRKGNFTTDRPVTSKIYAFLSRLQIRRYFNLDFPLLRDSHYDLTGKMLHQAQKAFKKQFPQGRFAVLIYPGAAFGYRLLPSLKEAGVEYFDYTDLVDLTDLRYHIFYDDHPTPLTHRIVARELAKDLGLVDATQGG